MDTMAVLDVSTQGVTGALQAIPFASMIGGPLQACISAQAMAARASLDYIREVGMTTDPHTGEPVVVYLSFLFVREGRVARLKVPLLAVVPVPYMAVQTVDISFKACISAAESGVTELNESQQAGGELEAGAGVRVGLFGMEAKLKANYSSKKDSKATQESKYCVEYTMDVAIRAGQDGMPAGMARVLELLGSSLAVEETGGNAG